MKTQNQTDKVLLAHRNDLQKAETALTYWAAKVKAIKAALREHEKEALQAQVVRSKEVIK